MGKWRELITVTAFDLSRKEWVRLHYIYAVAARHYHRLQRNMTG
jgi:hypothetical protein